MEEVYDFREIEKKWQKKWEEKKIFQVNEKSRKNKCYVLEMLPYPSSSGLHMGHALNYSIGDVYARFKRMKGFNVLYPMGFDAMGLPAENAAIKAGEHPKFFTEKAIKNYIRQMKELGLSYDWTRTLSTYDSEYIRWNQFFFLKFLKAGLIYQKKAPVNWCPKCQTVLANEQVHSGRCWRHEDTDIEIRHLKQWYLKTTKYAEELLDKLENLDWPERIKSMQRNWIGKSSGIEIDFEVNGKKFPIFTTRPDTIFGVTFMVISLQHEELENLISKEQKSRFGEFLKKFKSVSEKDAADLEKQGIFTGSYAIHPITQKKIPIYAGNFVVADYGSGMVMAVPAHDSRDFEFAKKYEIEIKQVIEGKITENSAYSGKGKLINSERFDGINSDEAIEKISEFIIKKGIGRKVINYKLRDWGFSRQRYWGTPIPIINCEKCGTIPVSEKELPVLLPKEVEFGKGNPLKTNEKWMTVKCPKCGKEALREAETMDTFFDSSWYFLRYCDNYNENLPFDKKKIKYWMPVNKYIGGAEHACMHLIYARFFIKALRDLKFLNFDEPFVSLFNQGMLHGSDGEKMSKSKGNVINPDSVSEKYGMDTARFFLLSLASPEKDRNWSEEGIQGSLKFIKKVACFNKFGKTDKLVLSKLNRTIKEIGEDIEFLRYNFAIIKLRNLFESFERGISKKDFLIFIKLMSVFCPHLAEEIWNRLGNKTFISLEKWPKFDEKKIDDKLEEKEMAIDKLGKDIRNIIGILELKGEIGKKKAKIYCVPKEVEFYKENLLKIKKSTSLEIEILSISEAAQEGKKIKAQPGKPGIFIE